MVPTPPGPSQKPLRVGVSIPIFEKWQLRLLRGEHVSSVTQDPTPDHLTPEPTGSPKPFPETPGAGAGEVSYRAQGSVGSGPPLERQPPPALGITGCPDLTGHHPFFYNDNIIYPA